MDILNIYIAGFFDGEGCISSQEYWERGKYEKYPRINLQISITNTNKEVLNLIRGVFGGTVRSHGKKKRNHKKCYDWKLCGKEKMRVFLTSILPYLVVKKEDAELGLKFIETLREENLGCVPLTVDIHKLRYEIHLALRKRKPTAPHIRNDMKQRAEIAGTSRTDNPQPSPEKGRFNDYNSSVRKDDGIV